MSSLISKNPLQYEGIQPQVNEVHNLHVTIELPIFLSMYSPYVSPLLYFKSFFSHIEFIEFILDKFLCNFFTSLFATASLALYSLDPIDKFEYHEPHYLHRNTVLAKVKRK